MNKKRVVFSVCLFLVLIISLSFVFGASSAKIDGVVKFRGYQYFAFSNGERSHIYAIDNGEIYLQRPSFGGMATDYFVFDKGLGNVNVEPLGNFIDLNSNALDYIGDDLFNQLNRKMIDDAGIVNSESESVELKINKNGVMSDSGITINGRGYLTPSNNKNEKMGEMDKTGKVSMYDPSTYSSSIKNSLAKTADLIHNTLAENGKINDLTKISNDGYASPRNVKTQTNNPFVEAIKRTGQRIVDGVTGKKKTNQEDSDDSSNEGRSKNPITPPGTKPSPGIPGTKPSPPGTKPGPKPTPPATKPSPKPKPVKNTSVGGVIKPSTPKNCYDGTIMGTTSPLQCGCKTELSYVKSSGKCNINLGVPSATNPPAYRTFVCEKPNGDDALNMVWKQDVDNCCISKGGDSYCAQQYPKKYPVCDNSNIPGKCISGCRTNNDCPSVGGVATDKVCDTSVDNGVCVECLERSDCSGEKICEGKKCIAGVSQELSCSTTWEEQNYIPLPFHNIADQGYCGDGYCSGANGHFETYTTCPQDCTMHPEAPVCGNCVCDQYAGGYATHNNRNRRDEGLCNCPQDCGFDANCGGYNYPNGQQML